MAVGIDTAHRIDRSLNLRGVVRIIVDVGNLRRIEMPVETTPNAREREQAVPQLIGIDAIEPSHGHSGHAVLYIDPNGHAQAHVGNGVVGSMKIEIDVALLVDTDVVGIEIRRLGGAIRIKLDALAELRRDGQPLLDDKRRPDERGVMLEALAIGLGGAINIQMVGVDGRNDGHIRCEIVERTVVLVRLDHNVVAIALDQHIGAVIVANAAQKGIGTDVRLVQKMG